MEPRDEAAPGCRREAFDSTNSGSDVAKSVRRTQGGQPQAEEAILNLGTLRKSPEWSNEKEWRVVSSRREGEVRDYSDYPFHPAELSTIFLGPRMPTQDSEALIGAAQAFPHARIVKVEIGGGQGFQFKSVRL